MSFIGSMFSSSQGAGFNPYANQNSALGQSSAAAASQLGGVNTQLQNEATNGSGLAQAQLAQATGQNIQQNTGMIASTKGLNPALAARQASENASQANQAAAGQSAALQAQTQLAAQQQLSGNLTNQQQIYQNALAAQNSAQSGVAVANANNSASALGGLTSGLGLAAGLAHGGMVPEFAQGGMMMPRFDDGGMMGSPNVAGGWTPGAALGISSLPPPPAGDNFVNPTPLGVSDQSKNKVEAQTPSQSGGGANQQVFQGAQAAGKGIGKGIGALAGLFAEGGKVNNMTGGGHVPGKAKVAGDSLKNDVVNAKLSPGEVVIPRSVMNSKDPVKGASKFVAALLAKQGMKHGTQKNR